MNFLDPSLPFLSSCSFVSLSLSESTKMTTPNTVALNSFCLRNEYNFINSSTYNSRKLSPYRKWLWEYHNKEDKTGLIHYTNPGRSFRGPSLLAFFLQKSAYRSYYLVFQSTFVCTFNLMLTGPEEAGQISSFH